MPSTFRRPLGCRLKDKIQNTVKTTMEAEIQISLTTVISFFLSFSISSPPSFSLIYPLPSHSFSCSSHFFSVCPVSSLSFLSLSLSPPFLFLSSLSIFTFLSIFMQMSLRRIHYNSTFLLVGFCRFCVFEEDVLELSDWLCQNILSSDGIRRV